MFDVNEVHGSWYILGGYVVMEWLLGFVWGANGGLVTLGSLLIISVFNWLTFVLLLLVRHLVEENHKGWMGNLQLKVGQVMHFSSQYATSLFIAGDMCDV